MHKPIHLYLDIDGVLLHRDESRWGYCVAPGTREFLTWAAPKFELVWLSTRCRTGDAEEACRAFRLAGGGDIAVVKEIPAAQWSQSKLEAIDLTRSDWYWIDDLDRDEQERALLREHGLLNHFILVEDGDPGALERVRERLKELMG